VVCVGSVEMFETVLEGAYFRPGLGAHIHQPLDYTHQRSQPRHSNSQSTTTTSSPDHSLTYTSYYSNL